MKSPVSKSNTQVEAPCARDEANLILRTEERAPKKLNAVALGKAFWKNADRASVLFTIHSKHTNIRSIQMLHMAIG